jgi:hypothetical protein
MLEPKATALLVYHSTNPKLTSCVARFLARNGIVWLVAIATTIAVCLLPFEGAWSWGHFDSRFWVLMGLDDDIRMGFKPRLTNLGIFPLHLLRGILVLGTAAIARVIYGRFARKTSTPDG